MAPGTLIGQPSQGVMLAAIRDVTPNQLRGQVTAIGLNLLGMGLVAALPRYRREVERLSV